MAIPAIAAAIIPVIKDILEKNIDNTAKAQEISLAVTEAAANVVVAEVQGESWLQRNWRPGMMVWFAILIGAYWFGFVPINMPVEIVSKLFDLVTLGIGGYIGGRTLEKVVANAAPILKKN